MYFHSHTRVNVRAGGTRTTSTTTGAPVLLLLQLVLQGTTTTTRARSTCSLHDDIDETIEEGLVVQDGFGRVAALEARSATISDAVDGPSEVAEEIARPSSEFSLLVSHDKM